MSDQQKRPVSVLAMATFFEQMGRRSRSEGSCFPLRPAPHPLSSSAAAAAAASARLAATSSLSPLAQQKELKLKRRFAFGDLTNNSNGEGCKKAPSAVADPTASPLSGDSKKVQQRWHFVEEQHLLTTKVARTPPSLQGTAPTASRTSAAPALSPLMSPSATESSAAGWRCLCVLLAARCASLQKKVDDQAARLLEREEDIEALQTDLDVQLDWAAAAERLATKVADQTASVAMGISRIQSCPH
eukprot:NODE_2843_length_1107_cov_28.778828_g2607_i0.p1 GENE.NODE_2843_length_1107_cov_28.778828_g2607_i0~~NODE_2843_length_1107_cov_28.778828_g2607_i0.p1  ORF type:complete len:244 (-),score=54.74 NODE_2843_length_1107_cov_28.778828_g2607_i0:283-1014(-)